MERWKCMFFIQLFTKGDEIYFFICLNCSFFKGVIIDCEGKTLAQNYFVIRHK